MVMALICLGPALCYAEEYENRFLQLISCSNCVFQSMVIFGPLCGLHPVKHIFPITDLPVVKQLYSFFLNHSNK